MTEISVVRFLNEIIGLDIHVVARFRVMRKRPLSMPACRRLPKLPERMPRRVSHVTRRFTAGRSKLAHAPGDEVSRLAAKHFAMCWLAGAGSNSFNLN